MSLRKLRPYQRQVLYSTLKRRHNALFLDMRLGKTLITIRSICTRFPRFRRVLIVCPFAAFDAWRTELMNDGFAENEIVLLVGERKKRRNAFEKALNDNKRWFVINVEGWRLIPEIANVKWDVVVADESYFLQAPPHVNINKKTGEKSPCTSKFFTENFRDVPAKYILTGTPAPESELNYFMQLLFLDESILGERNFWRFREKYFIEYMPHRYSITRAGKDFLTKRLATCATFLTRKDVNLGGEKIYETRKIDLDKRTRKTYNDIWNNFAITVEELIKEVTDIGGVRFQWARQLLGGVLNDAPFNGKIDELTRLLSGELSGQQIVIWADYTAEIDLIKRSFPCAEIIDGRIEPERRIEIVNDFRSGKIQYLICQPKAAQYSFNLSNADTEIYYSSPLSLKDRLQSEDRLISAKTNSVLVVDLICNDTLEEDIIISLRRKENKQEMIRRIVQRIAQRIERTL